MQKCILCLMTPKPTSKLLDRRGWCPACATMGMSTVIAPRHTPLQAKEDSKNKVTAVTITIPPKYRHVPEEDLQAYFKKVIKTEFRSFSTPSYAHFVAEYHEDGTPHWHGFLICRARINARVCAGFRKLKQANHDNIMLKPIYDLSKWSEYMYADYEEGVSLPPLKITS